MLEVRLLGNFDIKRGKKTVSIPSRPAQSLFAFLILNAGTAYRREKLAGQLWPDTTEESARDYLRHALWRIRKALQAASAGTYLQADDLTISFNGSSDYWLDAAALRDVKEAGPIDQLAKALSGYAGELLPGFYDEWVVLEREHLQAVYERKVGCLLDLLDQAGRWQEVLQWAEKWIALGQKPESAYRHLMSAYAAQGDMVKSATTFERCVKSLAEFGIEPSEQTRELYKNLKAGKGPKSAQPKRVSVESGRSVFWNVPHPLTSFIGREHEIAGIVRLLEAHKLITLTGPGGVGKTRLATQVANRMRDNFIDGVCWVELAALSDPNLVPQAITASLDIRKAAGQSLTETLKGYLASKKLLLILDNCEHLILACARIAELLAGSCPHLKILTTSREPLGILGERVFGVPTLSVPQPQRMTLIDVLLEYESIRLFIERARAVRPEFELTEQNATAVHEICQRLDGIPLALELAAARTRLLMVEHIAERLNDRFSLLTQGSRTALPRQQTLRATIDWSYDQLPDDARLLFQRLSIFAGGFTMEAAEAICSEPPLSSHNVIDLLARLVDRSLVQVQHPRQDERYDLLETIREYGHEKLQASGEHDELCTRHLDFYLQLAEQAEPKLIGAEQHVVFARLDIEYGNLRSAIEWAMEKDTVKVLRLTAALGKFYQVRGYSIEGRKAIAEALQRAVQAPKEMRAKGLLFLGSLSIDQGDYAAAKANAQASIREMQADTPMHVHSAELVVDAHLLEARAKFLSGETTAVREQLDIALSLARRYHYVRGEYNALAQLGTSNWSAGNYRAATGLMEQALLLVRQAGDVRREFEILNNLGIVSKARARFSEAIDHFEHAQEIARKIGDRSGEATLLSNMGSASLASGDFVQAGLYSEQAAAMAAELQEPILQGNALINRGEAYRELGQYLAAKATAAQALALVRSGGYRRGEAIVLHNIGLVEFALGNYAQALEATQEAMAVAREIGARPTEAGALTHLGRIYAEAGQFEDAGEALAAAIRVAEDLGDPAQLLEVQATLAALALARGGTEYLERAQSEIEELVSEILKEPPTEQSHILPLWMYLTCIRVLHVRSDPRATQLIARSAAELRARCEKILDPAVQNGYMNMPEHRAITASAAAQT